jgi:hypothetical protein
LRTAILHLPLDAVETRHGCPASLVGNILTFILNHYGQNLLRMGCSDSHIPYSAGHAFTWFPGSTGADVRRAIESGTIRPGGPYMWTMAAMWRKVLVIRQRGWLRYDPQEFPTGDLDEVGGGSDWPLTGQQAMGKHYPR